MISSIILALFSGRIRANTLMLYAIWNCGSEIKSLSTANSTLLSINCSNVYYLSFFSVISRFFDISNILYHFLLLFIRQFFPWVIQITWFWAIIPDWYAIYTAMNILSPVIILVLIYALCKRFIVKVVSGFKLF